MGSRIACCPVQAKLRAYYLRHLPGVSLVEAVLIRGAESSCLNRKVPLLMPAGTGQS
jgi:hypothetical protein